MALLTGFVILVHSSEMCYVGLCLLQLDGFGYDSNGLSLVLGSSICVFVCSTGSGFCEVRTGCKLMQVISF